MFASYIHEQDSAFILLPKQGNSYGNPNRNAQFLISHLLGYMILSCFMFASPAQAGDIRHGESVVL